MALIARRTGPSSVWLDDLFRWPASVEWPEATGTESKMRIEEFTDGSTLVVRAELPGVNPDKDVEITVSDGMLQITAERKQEMKTEEKGQHRSEFHYGMLSRSVPLPVGAAEGDIKATFEDGILEVRVPVDQKQAKDKKISITRR